MLDASANIYFDPQEDIHKEIRSLVLQKNYPCVAAIQSVLQHEYLVGMYGDFGSGKDWQRLRHDLLNFLKTLNSTGLRYLSFWAIFNPLPIGLKDDTEYDKKFWRELSLLTSEEDKLKDWGANNISDPNDPSFCLSLNGEKFFVVGMHPQSPRL